LFERALEPLTQLEEGREMFREFVEGSAGVVNLIASTIALSADEIQATFNELGSELQEPIRDFVRATSSMFLTLRDDFVAMSKGIVTASTSMIEFMTRFANGISENTQLIGELREAIAGLAQVGRTAFEGVAPILTLFAEAMAGVAEIINSLNAGLVSGAITITLLVGLLSKLAGMFGGLISIIPNLTFAIKTADGSMMSLMKSFGGFLRQHGTIFGGFVSLADNIEDAGEEMTIFAARSQISEEALEDVDDSLSRAFFSALNTSQSLEELQEEVIEAALAADASERDFNKVRNAMVQAGLAAEGYDAKLDEIDATNARNAILAAFGPASGSMMDALTDSVDDINDELEETNDELTGAVGRMEALGVAADDVEIDRDRIDVDLDDSVDTGEVQGFNRGPGFTVPERLEMGSMTGKTDMDLREADDFGIARDRGGGGSTSRLSKLRNALAGLIPIGTSSSGVLSSLGSIVGSVTGAVVGLVTAVKTLLLALVALVATGGLAVGFIAHMDEIMSSLESTGNTMKEWLMDVANILKDDFINAWNAMVPLFMLAREQLEMLKNMMGDTGGTLSFLGDMFKWVMDFAVALLDVLVSVATIFNTINNIIIGVLVKGLKLLGQILSSLFTGLLDILGVRQQTMGFLNTLAEWIAELPENLMWAFNQIMSGFETLINNFIDGINEVISSLNNVGADIEQFNNVDITPDGDSGLLVDEEELNRDAEDISDGVLGGTENNLTFNEDNSTNIDQTIDADPEDQAQLSRVVTDAIEEANSFERRRQGGQ
jgi:hypothetical protein